MWLVYVIVAGIVVPIWWFVVPNLYRLTSLYRALAAGDGDWVEKQVKGDPSKLEYRFFGLNATPLHIAAQRGDTRMVSVLLDLGADIEAKGYRDECTPLHLAAREGQVETVRLLLARGAELDSHDRFLATPLMDAAGAGQADMVELLLERGADINARESVYGRSALDEAVESDEAGAARVLLEHGSDADLDRLIENKKNHLWGIPLATEEHKETIRRMIRLLEAYKFKRWAEEACGDSRTPS